MSTNDYITTVTDSLTDWDIDYRETTEGMTLWAPSDVAAAVLYAIS